MLKSMFQKIFEWLKSAGGITVAVSVILLALATWDQGPYILVNTVVTGGMLGLVAMGLAVILGVLNIAQFAHGEYFMIGGLTAYYVITPIQNYLTAHPNAFLAAVAPFVAMIFATLAGAIAGALTELLCFRPLRARSRANWVMNSFLLTVGLSVILVNGDLLIFGADFKGIVGYWQGAPLSVAGVYVSIDRVMAFILALAIVIGFWVFMKYSRTGQAIRAVAQDELGALMVGIGLEWIMVLTMALGCAMAAVAGASLLFMYPSYPTVGLEPLYMAWFVVILVGLGNVMGALIGGFMVSLLKVLTVAYVGEGWQFVIPSVLIILVLIFKPSGVFGSEVRGVLDQ
jgi:branched-chain amino acid transport system permease protein